MTNLHSRAVLKKAVAPLVFYVGNVSKNSFNIHNGTKYFSLKGLIDVVAEALGHWIDTYNKSPNKFIDFVRRYDLVISDARVSVMVDHPQ